MANGSRRFTGSRSRARARARTRTRPGSRTSTRTTMSTTRVREGSAAKYVLPALVVAGLAYLLWPRDAKADPNRPPPITPPPNNGRTRPWPPGTPEGSVNPVGTNPATGRPWNGLNTRTRPDPTAPLVSRNDAFRGQRIGIISVGHKQQGPQACERCEWFEIMTPGGSVGFARAVGPQGETNLVAHDPLPQQRIPVPTPVGDVGGAPGADIEAGGPATGFAYPHAFAAPPYANAFAGLAPYAAAASPAYRTGRW